MIVAATAVLLLVLWACGHYYSRSLERQLSARYPRDRSGIIAGAEEIRRAGTNGAAVLLIHGAGDTPQTLTYVCGELTRRGYAVVAPLLPGHGRSLADFAATSADEWYDTVRREYATLKATSPWVGVVGLSMGGALAARLAAEDSDMPALVLAAPYLRMPRVGDWIVRASWLWGLFVPYVNTSSGLSVLDPSARAATRSYGAMSVQALRALRTTANRGWDSLRQTRSPTLIVQSTLDNRVAAADTALAYEILGATDKVMEWTGGAGHVITVDYGWQRVTSLIGEWIDLHHH